MILVVVLVLGVAGTAVLLARESFTPETIRQPEQMQAEAEPQKEPEVENAAGEALSPAPEEAEQLLSATQEQSTSLPNLMGAWTQEEPPLPRWLFMLSKEIRSAFILRSALENRWRQYVRWCRNWS